MKTERIELNARRWFQQSAGNTYFTCAIYVNDELVHTLPRQYGYGDHYADIAQRWLVDNGYIPGHKGEFGYSALWRVCDECQIKYVDRVTDVNRKKDLHQ
jgi:hypothetical protein